MKISTYLTTIKRKGNEDTQRNESHLIDIIGCECDSYLGFRIREKGTDIKVRSEIAIVSDYWDADSSCYKQTRRVASEQLQKMNERIKTIITTLTDEFCTETASPSWVKDVIVRCLSQKPKTEDTYKPTLADRINEYVEQHPLSKNSSNFYLPIAKKLRRYEIYKQEIEEKKDFHLYVETITAKDYHEFVDFLANEHELYKQHSDFYEQFNLGRFIPKPIGQGGISHILTRLRAVHHWCIKIGVTQNSSCIEWQALYVPFSMEYDDWKDVCQVAYINNFHQYDDNLDGTIDRTELEVFIVQEGQSLKPNHPYLIRARETGEKQIQISDATIYPTESNTVDCSSTTFSYTFIGTYNQVSGSDMVSNQYYALGGGTLHQNTSAANSLNAMRWYLHVQPRGSQIKNTPSLAPTIRIRVMNMDDEEFETGIEAIEIADEQQGSMVDMVGRKVQPSTDNSGLYIKNGKKVFINR